MIDEKNKKVVLASDHAGFKLKETLKKVLEENNVPYEDMSPEFHDGDDYPDIAFKAAKRVAKHDSRGIFICGSGMGMCMCANKVYSIRAVRALSERTARLSRQEDDSNVLCMGARLIEEKDAIKAMKTWLTTRFLEGRHLRRVNKIKEYEKEF